jgi:hypothetical protein
MQGGSRIERKEASEDNMEVSQEFGPGGRVCRAIGSIPVNHIGILLFGLDVFSGLLSGMKIAVEMNSVL